GRPKDRWRPEAAGRIQRNWPAGRVRPVRRKEHGLSVEAEPAMYTVVLMAALAGGGESPALFHGNGCCGGYSCHGCNGGCHGGGFFHGGKGCCGGCHGGWSSRHGNGCCGGRNRPRCHRGRPRGRVLLRRQGRRRRRRPPRPPSPPGPPRTPPA